MMRPTLLGRSGPGGGGLRAGPGGGGLMIRREKMPLNYPIENQYLVRLGNENFRVGICLMQGLRDDMEDAHAACLTLKNHPDSGFFAVFDGHNGTQASLWAAKNVGDGFGELKNFTSDSIKEKMIELDDRYLKSTTDENAGATAVFAVLSAKEGKGDKPYKITVGNLGDSRCIVGHKDSKDFDPMTTDHKPDTPSEEARIVAAGGIVARGRVDCHLAVARAIGDGAYKKNTSLPPDKQKVICVPDITEAFLGNNDFVFICCDGIFESFKNEEVLEFIRNGLKNTDDTAKILSDLLNETLKRGSKDNMTAMIIELKDGRDYNKGGQFVPGEFYDKGNKTWLTSYQTDCERYNKTLDEAKELWLNLKKQKEEVTTTNGATTNGTSTSGVITNVKSESTPTTPEKTKERRDKKDVQRSQTTKRRPRKDAIEGRDLTLSTRKKRPEESRLQVSVRTTSNRNNMVNVAEHTLAKLDVSQKKSSSSRHLSPNNKSSSSSSKKEDLKIPSTSREGKSTSSKKKSSKDKTGKIEKDKQEKTTEKTTEKTEK